MSPQDGGHSCGRRQQTDDDGAVAGRSSRQREGCQQRKSQHHSAGHQRQARPLPPLRKVLLGQGKGCRCQEGGNNRAGGTDKERRKTAVLNRNPGHRQGQGKRCNAQQTPPEPGLQTAAGSG